MVRYECIQGLLQHKLGKCYETVTGFHHHSTTILLENYKTFKVECFQLTQTLKITLTNLQTACEFLEFATQNEIQIKI